MESSADLRALRDQLRAPEDTSLHCSQATGENVRAAFAIGDVDYQTTCHRYACSGKNRHGCRTPLA